MPTPRALLLIICPLLLLSLAGPLVAAQPIPAPEAEASHQAEDQQALRATVAEQARDLDRLSGKVDGLQTSLDSAAKAGEAASRMAQLVVAVVGIAGTVASVFVMVLGFLGWRRFRDALALVARVGDEAAAHAKVVADCEQRVQVVLGDMEAAAQTVTPYVDRIKHYADEAQAKARALQSIQMTAEVSPAEKQELSDLAARLDIVEALGLPLDPESYIARGNDLSQKGEHERAIQCYDKAIEMDSRLAAAHNARGVALAELGRELEALTAFETASDIDPDDAGIHVNLGLSLFALGRLDDAVIEYRRASQIDPNYREAYCNAGTALNRLGRHEESLTAFARVIDIDPDHAHGYMGSGSALHALGRYEEAVSMCNRAMRLDPSAEVGYYNRACTHSLLNHRAEALADLKKAIELDPSNGEHAKTDPDFESLRSDSDFRELVGLDPDPDQPAEN